MLSKPDCSKDKDADFDINEVLDGDMCTVHASSLSVTP